ncbi:class I adenylate-forming enzyme family protein [Ferribacterium limneticum]|uniref:class I adenylate-forming enzyme family protein n=1 Tax=Ferribacterium limneticum TaxID=76259 RepID=UPI001CF806A7|nr:AMP-binding protein [Ferribacterium limneticum]UCV22003.1 AMP-binding protein [Ferribacterium limneticum]
MNLSNLLFRTAKVFPDRPAIACGDRELYNYREFAARVLALSGSLRGYFGLRRGERVALFMQNSPHYLEILFAIWHAGLTAVPINNKLHPKEVAFILEDSGATLLFVTAGMEHETLSSNSAKLLQVIDADSKEYSELFHGGEATMASNDPSDLAWLFYTSGTTGKPKGVMLTHANLLSMTMCYFTDVDTPCKEGSILYAAPMSHGAGLYSFAHVIAGARHLVPESGSFVPAEIFELSQKYRNVSMFAAPTMVRRLVEHSANHDSDPSSIKTVVYGGGPMYLEDIRRALDVLGNRFVQIYGQGETPMTISALSKFHIGNTGHPRYFERLGSVGIAQTAVEVRIVDISGQVLPTGESGEIIVRGDTVMSGYWGNPTATLNTLRDGWLYTGDIGVLDQDGFLSLKDRSKDIIISGGSNIYPREVEEILLLHPGVAEVSVVGRPSHEWGEEVIAFIVPASGQSPDFEALDKLCLKHIARFKRPKEYRILQSLPKNNYGKVVKTELRRALAEER